MASAGSGNVIHLWDVTARQERCRLVGHTGSVTTLVFDRGISTLISGSYDTTVRLWDVKNRRRGESNAAIAACLRFGPLSLRERARVRAVGATK